MERPTRVTPEDRITNVLACLVELSEGPAHPHRMDAIRSTTQQLNDLWRDFRAGRLEPIEDTDGVMF